MTLIENQEKSGVREDKKTGKKTRYVNNVFTLTDGSLRCSVDIRLAERMLPMIEQDPAAFATLWRDTVTENRLWRSIVTPRKVNTKDAKPVTLACDPGDADAMRRTIVARDAFLSGKSDTFEQVTRKASRKS